MASGGIDVKQRTREIIRLSGIVAPLILALLGAFADQHSPEIISFNIITWAVLVPWILLGLLIYFFPAKNKPQAALRLVVYHGYAAAYILVFSGFLTQFVAVGWVFLLLASYMYLAVPGVLLSLGTLLFAGVFDIWLHGSGGGLLLIDAVSIISIFIIGIAVISLSRVQQDDSDALVQSQANETLQRNRIDTLINNLADAVISLDNEGKVVIYNAASLSLLNTNVSPFGRPIDEVIKVKNQKGKTVSLLAMAKKSPRLRVRDDLSLFLDGETIRLEVTASPVRSSNSRAHGPNSPDGYVLILRDITKAKSLEEERDEFISVVSHELRTPITITEGTLSNVKLMIERGTVPPGTLEHSLNEAHEQILFLARMVNDLSTLSRAERGVADAPEEIDVKKLLTSLYGEYSPEAAKKHLQFDLDITGKLGTVSASHLYLRELLQNFITNAIKYTKEGTITLVAEQKGGMVYFEVKDTGIGMSKTDRARVFEKFYRSEDYRTRETGGTGLGLYVAAKLAKKLGTTIGVKSRLNYGSSFSFSLPVTKEEN